LRHCCDTKFVCTFRGRCLKRFRPLAFSPWAKRLNLAPPFMAGFVRRTSLIRFARPQTCVACVELAAGGRAAYAGGIVKPPFVNVEEKIDRFVGRRPGTPDSLRAGMQLQATAARLHKSFGHRWWPKGVYRFKTHEEADLWMIKMLAQSGRPKT